MERYDYQAEPEDLNDQLDPADRSHINEQIQTGYGEDLGLQPDLPELEAKHLSTEKKPEQ